MKKLLFLLLPCALIAQQKEDQNVVQGQDLLMTRKAASPTIVDGSPYIQNDYIPGHLANNSKNHQLRYNAYTDDIEFKQNGEILIANKIPGQKFIFNSGETYTTLHYSLDGNVSSLGYLVELVSNPEKYSLYKKQSVKKIDALEGLNSYQSSKNSYYEKQKDQYLILHNGNYYTLPSSIRKMEGEYKDMAAKFNKQNNLKLNDESLTLFVNWLNSK